MRQGFLSDACLRVLILAAPLGALATGCTGTLDDANAGVDPDGDGQPTDPNELDAVAAPGRSLSSTELANTYTSLFGWAPEALAQLPADPRDHIFDRVFEAQSISALHLDVFQTIAREVHQRMLSERLFDDVTAICADSYLPPASMSLVSAIPGIALGAAPAWAVCHEAAPCTGDDVSILYSHDPAVSHALDAAPGTYSLELEVTVNEDVSFELWKDGTSVHAGDAPSGTHSLVYPLEHPGGGANLQWRFTMSGSGLLTVHQLRVDGPTDAGADLYASERDACALALIEELAPRAYRRPATQEELTELQEIYDEASTVGGFYLGTRAVLDTLLQSPHFLYLIEHGSPETEHRELTLFELATRLSYALTESPPDEGLWAAAESGNLADPTVLAQHAVRLLDSAAGRMTTSRFFAQWLAHDRLPDAAREPTLYPSFTADVREQLELEAAAFLVASVYEDGRSLRELFAAGDAFVSASTAELYGVDAPPAGAAVRALLPAYRAGILTHPATLAANAKFDHSSPIGRGKFVIERLLCQDLPAPPQDVDTTPPPFDPTATTRDRFDIHAEDPACSSCHQIIDPVGFSMEDFDAIGRHRAHENGLPVDASGGVPSLDIDDGAIVGGAELGATLAERAELGDCFAQQYLRFVLGRAETELNPAMPSVADATASEVLRSSLLSAVMTESFRLRRDDDEGGA